MQREQRARSWIVRRDLRAIEDDLVSRRKRITCGVDRVEFDQDDIEGRWTFTPQITIDLAGLLQLNEARTLDVDCPTIQELRRAPLGEDERVTIFHPAPKSVLALETTEHGSAEPAGSADRAASLRNRSHVR